MSRHSPIAHSPPADVGDAVARLGKRIRAAREDLGLSQKELAERIAVSRSTVIYLERGTMGTAVGIYFKALQAVGLLDSMNRRIAAIEQAESVSGAREQIE